MLEGIEKTGPSLGEGRRLGRQRENRPDALDAGNGFRTRAEAQAQLALETAHPAREVNEQETIFFEPSGSFVGGKSQAFDRAD